MSSDKNRVYLPSEDTAVLAKALRSYSGERCLEIGFGSGAILESLTPRFGIVVGTDVLTLEEAGAAKGGAEVVLADRARCFRDAVFDLVAFNPPYLPSDSFEDRTVDGGELGLEIPLGFLDEALRVVRRGGNIVLLLSDQADIEQFLRMCEGRGALVEEVARTPLFFESLVVFRITRA